MDIQLFTTDEELRNSLKTKLTLKTILTLTQFLVLIASTYQFPTFLNLNLVYLSEKLDVDAGLKEATDVNLTLNSKNPIEGHSVVQVNDHLVPIQEKQSVIQMIDAAYLGQSFSWSLSQPVVAPPIVGQSGVGQSSVDQPSCPIPPLLSLWLQPDLNMLAQTLSPDSIKLNYNG